MPVYFQRLIVAESFMCFELLKCNSNGAGFASDFKQRLDCLVKQQSAAQ